MKNSLMTNQKRNETQATNKGVGSMNTEQLKKTIKRELVTSRDTMNKDLPDEQRQFLRGYVHGLKFIQQQLGE